MTDLEIMVNIEKLGSKYLLALAERKRITLEQYTRIQDHRRKTGIWK